MVVSLEINTDEGECDGDGFIPVRWAWRWIGLGVGLALAMHVVHINYVLCLFLNKTFLNKMNCAVYGGSDFLQH